MEGIRYTVRNLSPQVPLHDKENKAYMLVIDGEPLDIPESVFFKLFEVERPIEKPIEKKVEVEIESPISKLKNLNMMYEQMKTQILNFKKMGMSEESVQEMTKKALVATNMSEFIDDAVKVVSEIYKGE